MIIVWGWQFSIFIRIKTSEEIIIGTAIDFLKLNQHADTDIQFARLIFFVGGSANITVTMISGRMFEVQCREVVE